MAEETATLEDRLAALRTAFLVRLDERIGPIEAAAHRLSGGLEPDAERQALTEVMTHAHKLAGSGATFGFPALSAVGRELETHVEAILEAGRRASRSEIAFIATQAANLRDAAEPESDLEAEPAPEPTASDLAARVLLVEDDPAQARVYLEYLKNERCESVHAETGAAAMASIESRLPDVILLDLMLPDMNGLDILREISARDLPVAVIVITAHGSVKVAVEAMRLGARDFLVKPFNAARLLVTLRNTLEHGRLRRIVEAYRELDLQEFGGFIGASIPMQQVYRIIESAAPSKATVFISGESGTGKEIGAHEVHRRGGRRDKPFVVLNCGAIPRDLMESEIFGHVKGAFTGAIAGRDGAARRADGGTLFLDEICEMDLALQTKLLRFVQSGTFQKVGGDSVETVDVRFVCATNRDPWEEVAAGRFREDLFYRLHVIPIAMPPLRERGDDVLMIARRFLVDFARDEGKAFARFDSAVEDILLAYAWPGNVRELQNLVRNVVVLNDGDTVTAAMLPAPLSSMGTAPRSATPRTANGAEPAVAALDAPMPGGIESIRPLAEIEREAIERAVTLCDGNIPRAAHHLGVSASTLYRKKQLWEQG